MPIPVILTEMKAGSTPWYNSSGNVASYLGIVRELNSSIGQLTGVLTGYGTTTLLSTFQLHPTTIQMHEYVQGIAFTGVNPSEIGSPNDILCLTPDGNSFTGKTFTQIETSSSKKRKLWAKFTTLMELTRL